MKKLSECQQKKQWDIIVEKWQKQEKEKKRKQSKDNPSEDIFMKIERETLQKR